MLERYDDARACAEDAIAHVGKRIVLGLPLGLGKANHLANAFFNIAKKDSSIELDIFTALTLEIPRAAPGLESRFLQPILDRLFQGYVELEYAKARRNKTMPDNIVVREFFLPTGTLINNDYAQQEYLSANYTHATRRVLESGINVLAQLIAVRDGPNGRRISLASNPDLAVDVIPAMHAQKERPVAVLGEVNANMPFMMGDAEAEPRWFDAVLDGPQTSLYGLPTSPVTLQDHAIGLHASTLIKDGGTLQIGIGSLADAISHALLVRHKNNAAWVSVIGTLNSAFAPGLVAATLGDRGPFKQGIYACSEMISDGLLALLEQGIVSREVRDDGKAQGRTMDGGFFLGSRDFYRRLNALDDVTRAKINMTSVGKVNALYGDELQRRRQRIHGRFVNSVMEVSGLGGAASDALADGRIVSGVGGQFNFVAMAQELEGARSILLVRSTKMLGGRLHSNFVWERPNETIPRHLKDIVISEYGIADLRGQTDSETAKRLIAICDSRFQAPLLEAAKKARKIEASYEIPGHQRENTPEKLSAALGPARAQNLLPPFPFGSDLNETEVVLAETLRHLKANTQTLQGVARLARDGLRAGNPPPEAEPYLARLGLWEAESFREKALRRLVIAALRETGAITG
ncbi:MAG: acetyl-CoA hydrolase/transferase C-terminal domain-containing protein [Alphaproteobacteria bacterium]